MTTEETTTDELTSEERTGLMVKEVAAATLNKELKGSFYSICSVVKAADMGGDRFSAYMSSREYKILKALHCVQYNDIPEGVKVNIALLTQSLLRPLIGELKISDKKCNGVNLFETRYLPDDGTCLFTPTPTPTPPKVSWYERLFDRIGLGLLD